MYKRSKKTKNGEVSAYGFSIGLTENFTKDIENTFSIYKKKNTYFIDGYILGVHRELSSPSIKKIRQSFTIWKRECIELLILKGYAESCANFRGHKLGKWEESTGINCLRNTCIKCGKEIDIILYPKPNETDISGEVASSCKKKNIGQ